jgi:hypothetical protein
MFVQAPRPHIAIFDASGKQNCNGNLPSVCTEIGRIDFAGGVDTEIPSVGGRLFVETRTAAGGPLQLRAYQANAPFGLLWSSNVSVFPAAPAVANNVVYAARDDGGEFTVAASDAAGTAGCSGTPAVCAPRFTAFSGPAVAGDAHVDVIVASDLLIASSPTAIEFFDAKGERGCSGTPPRCALLFGVPNPENGITKTYPFAGHPTVGNGFLYFTGTDNAGTTTLFAMRPGA